MVTGIYFPTIRSLVLEENEKEITKQKCLENEKEKWGGRNFSFA